MASYGDQIKAQCFKLFLKDVSMTEISAAYEGKPTIQTLYNWAEAGEPKSETGGLSWHEYRDRMLEKQIQHSREKSLVRESESEKAFLDRAKDMTREAFTTVYHRILDGSADVRGSDLDKMMRLYLLLDNQAAEQINWMEHFATQVFGIAFEVMNEQQYNVFKSKVLDLQYKKKKELDPVVSPRAIVPARS
jgi:hypothetical protein